MLLAALELFECQALHVQILAALDWKPEDSGTTQKEDVKMTPGKMLPSILSKQCMCAILIFVL